MTNKKQSNWSYAGYAFGITFALGTFIRYYILYPDLDKAITDIIIGLAYCGLAWLYNAKLNDSNRLCALEDYIDDKPWHRKTRG